MKPRIDRPLRFLRVIDRLKTVLRRNKIIAGKRHENSAEHSWHLAMAVLAMKVFAPRGTRVDRAVAMALVHDLPELLIGDTFLYDTKARIAKARREAAAANRLFGRRAGSSGPEMLRLWREFEAGVTPTSKYVRALDRILPMMANAAHHGGVWRNVHIPAARVRAVNLPVLRAVRGLAEYADRLLTGAERKGYFSKR